MITFSDGISALAFIVSVAALVASTMRWREERKRTIRGQLSDVLRQIGSALLENQKVLHEVGQGNPEYFQQLSAALNQQQAFLQQQAIYLAVQIPDLVSSVEHIAIAFVSALQGDLIRADEYYKKAVALAPDSTYRLTARRAYAWFLFTQRRFEEGRKQYEAALSDYTGSDNFARSQRGLTYQFLGQNELTFAKARTRAEEAFESAEGEFNGIDIESVRQAALKKSAIRKDAIGRRSPNRHEPSRRVSESTASPSSSVMTSKMAVPPSLETPKVCAILRPFHKRG